MQISTLDPEACTQLCIPPSVFDNNIGHSPNKTQTIKLAAAPSNYTAKVETPLIDKKLSLAKRNNLVAVTAKKRLVSERTDNLQTSHDVSKKPRIEQSPSDQPMESTVSSCNFFQHQSNEIGSFLRKHVTREEGSVPHSRKRKSSSPEGEFGAKKARLAASDAPSTTKANRAREEDIPVFFQSDISFESLYENIIGQPLPDNMKGKKIIKLADAIIECFNIIKNKEACSSYEIQSICKLEKRLCYIVKNMDTDNCGSPDSGLVRFCFDVGLLVECFEGGNVFKRVNSCNHLGFGGLRPIETFYDLNIVILKLINRFMINKVYIIPRIFLSDLLFFQVSGDIFLPLHFNSDQFAKWQDTINTIDNANITFLYPENLAKILRKQKASEWNTFRDLGSGYWDQQRASFILGFNPDFQVKPDNDKFMHFIQDATNRLLFRPDAGNVVSLSGLPSANAGVQKNHTATTSSLKTATENNQLLIGEEFEYWVDDSHRTIDSKGFEEVAKQCDHEFRQLLALHKVGSYQIKKNKDDYRISIGSWKAKIFCDDGGLEINITPYTIHQKFRLNINGQDEDWSVYQLFDRFIHPLAKNLGFCERSGHKHFEFEEIIEQGNIGFMFRFLIYMEQLYFLPKAVGRLDSLEYFNYAAENNKKIKILKAMIAEFNKRLEDGHDEKNYGKFSDIIQFRDFLKILDMNGKYTACAFHHLEEAEHTADINTKPTTTVEIRQFHCPRSGDEILLLNELWDGLVKHLLQCQKQREPISYEPVNPISCKIGKDEEVVRAFVKFVRQCGGEPSRYKPLLRMPVPETCLPLFQPLTYHNNNHNNNQMHQNIVQAERPLSI